MASFRGIALAFGILALASPARAEKPDTALYTLNFAEIGATAPLDWLAQRGFQAKRNADDSRKLALTAKDGALVLEARRSCFGFLINGALKQTLKDARRIRVEWGVDLYPKGASWDQDINREALMIYVFFGDKNFSSGNFLLPSSPYFIGLFLGEKEKVLSPYLGRNYRQCGRYVCLANPKPGQAIVSEYDLADGFKKCFSLPAPTVTGFSLEVDTSGTDEGKSKAFIRKIQFLK